MVVLNVSFMMLREVEADFLRWIRGEWLARLDFSAESGPRCPRLSALREAGGEDASASEAHTVAFQMEFAGLADAHAWERDCLGAMTADYIGRFGPDAMVFTSIFEVLE